MGSKRAARLATPSSADARESLDPTPHLNVPRPDTWAVPYVQECCRWRVLRYGCSTGPRALGEALGPVEGQLGPTRIVRQLRTLGNQSSENLQWSRR